MARVEVHVPLTLRLVGRPTEADWQRLEEALVRRFARAFSEPDLQVPQPPREDG